jgi:hypothetical protein
MRVTVDVQVDEEVITKYLARMCMCMEVNALKYNVAKRCTWKLVTRRDPMVRE